MQLIQKHGSIEEILKNLDQTKYPVDPSWPYEEARRLFLQPEVTNPEEIDLKWADPDEEGLVEFMCTKNGFQEERIRNGVKRIKEARGKTVQGRLDTFFKPMDSVSSQTAASKKRKAEEEAAAAKKKKSGAFKPRK